MADKDKQFQDVIIRFTEIVEKQANVIKHLSDVRKGTVAVDKALQNKAKTISRLKKISDTAFSRMAKAMSLVRGTFVAAGGAIAIALGAVVKSIHEAGTAFNSLAVTSADAGKSIVKLREAYSKFGSESMNSLIDFADTYSKFQKNIFRRTLDPDKMGLSKFVDVLSRGVGLETAQQEIFEFFDSLEEYPDMQKILLDKIGKMDISKSGSLFDIAKQISAAGSMPGASAEAAVNLVQMLSTESQALSGNLEAAAMSQRNLTSATMLLGKVFDDVQDTLARAFGPHLTELLKHAAQWLSVTIPKAVDYLEQKFQKLGGVPKIIEMLSSAWKTSYEWVIKTADYVKTTYGPAITEALTFAVETVKTLVSWLGKAFEMFPKLTLAAGGFMALFGVKNTAMMFAGFGKNIAKALGGKALTAAIANPLISVIVAGITAAIAATAHVLSTAHSELKQIQTESVEAAKTMTKMNATKDPEQRKDLYHENIKNLQKYIETQKESTHWWNFDSAEREENIRVAEKQIESYTKLIDAKPKGSAAGGILTLLGSKEAKDKVKSFASTFQFMKTKVKETATSFDILTAAIGRANVNIAQFAQTEKMIDSLGSQIEGFAAIMMSFGPSAMAGNASIAETLQKNTVQSQKEYEIARQKVAIQSQLIQDLEKQLATEEDVVKRGQLEVQINTNNLELSRQITKMAQAKEQTVKSTTVKQESELARIGRTRDLLAEELRLSEATYGTAALAVENRMQMVRVLDSEREQYQQIFDMRAHDMAVAEEQLALAASQGAEAGTLASLQMEVFFAEQKKLEAAKEVRRVQADQLQQVKELRDGYLDAVEAQAFGAGKFEKIIISQEQNIAKGLEKRIAKGNFTLGQVRDAAGRSKVNPYRYGAGGVGQLTTMDGNTLSSADIAKQNAEIVKNIGDPIARALVQESQKMLGGAMSAQTESQVKNTAAIDNLTKAINAKYLPTGAVSALASGSPAAQTAVGEASRQAMSGGSGSVSGFFKAQNVPNKTSSQFIRDQKKHGHGAAIKLKRQRGRIGAAKQRLAGADSRLTAAMQSEGINVSGADMHGHDMRTYEQITKERGINKGNLDKLNRERGLARKQLERETQRENSMRRGFSGKKGISLDWSGMLKQAAAIFMKLGPFLEEMQSSQNNVPVFRQTRTSGRTSLGS